MNESIPNERLTNNWWLHEFLVSSQHPEVAAAMRPTTYHISNLHMLCMQVLQPTRDHFDMPFWCESGLRINGLNELVGGSETSVHPEGKAADIRPDDPAYLWRAFVYIKDTLKYCWAELIYYQEKGIIHVGLPHRGKAPFCKAVFRDGRTVYYRGGPLKTEPS